MVRACATGAYDFTAHDSRNTKDRMKLHLIMGHLNRSSNEQLLQIYLMHDLAMLLQNSITVPTELPDAARDSFNTNLNTYKRYLFASVQRGSDNKELDMMQRLRHAWEVHFGNKKHIGSALPNEDK